MFVALHFLLPMLAMCECNDLLLPPNHNESTILAAIRKLFPANETLNFVFGYRPPNYPSLHLIPNPRLVAAVSEEPLEGECSPHNANYLVYVSDYASLEDALTKLKSSPIWNDSNSPRGRFLVQAPESSSPERYFELLWSHDILNVILAADQDGSSAPTLLTSNPFEEGASCAKRPVSIRANFVADVSFATIFRSVKGCHLQLLPPNPISNNMQESGSYAVIANIIDVIAEVLRSNFSIFVTTEPKGIVYDRSRDISFLPTVSRAGELYEDYDLSGLLYSDEMDWVLPRSAQISDIKLLASVFESTMWGLILSVFVTTLVAWWAIARHSRDRPIFRDWGRSFLVIVDILFWGSTNILPITSALRVLALFYLVYCLLITTLFQARLMSVLTEPGREHQINTIKEFADSDLHPIIPKGFLSVAFANLDNPDFVKIKRRFVTPDEAKAAINMRAVAENRNYSTIMGRRLMHTFAREMGRVHVIDHNTGLLAVEVSVAMRKGHYIMDTLNRINERIFESGFHVKVLLDVTGDRNYGKKEKGRAGVFTIDHVLGGFTWWLVGLLISFAALIGELLHYQYKKRVAK